MRPVVISLSGLDRLFMESILMKTYDVVAAAIEAQETGHCFALLGDGNMHFAGALSHLHALYLCTA